LIDLFYLSRPNFSECRWRQCVIDLTSVRYFAIAPAKRLAHHWTTRHWLIHLQSGVHDSNYFAIMIMHVCWCRTL